MHCINLLLGFLSCCSTACSSLPLPFLLLRLDSIGIVKAPEQPQTHAPVTQHMIIQLLHPKEQACDFQQSPLTVDCLACCRLTAQWERQQLLGSLLLLTRTSPHPKMATVSWRSNHRACKGLRIGSRMLWTTATAPLFTTLSMSTSGR